MAIESRRNERVKWKLKRHVESEVTKSLAVRLRNEYSQLSGA